MRRRPPLGSDDGHSAADGVAPYAGSAVPGPMGSGAAFSHAPTVSAPRLAGDIAPAEIAVFTLGATTYRLRRLDAERRQGSGEIRVPPAQASAIIGEAAVKHQGDSDLVRLLETAAAHLEGLHGGGVYGLFRLKPQDHSGVSPVAQAGPVSTPSMLRPPTVPTLPPSLDEPMMGAAQAMALKIAAALGTPFCEECARLAARHDGSSAT